MNIVTRVAGVLLAGATLFGLAWASTASMPVFSSRDAIVRLSLGARPERVETCRTQTHEELEEVQPQMRQQVVCEGTTARYRLDVRRDGALLLSQVVRGGGLRYDRQLYVFRELVVPSGRSSIDVRFVRLDTVRAEAEEKGGRPERSERKDEEREGQPESSRRTDEDIAPDRAQRETEERRRRLQGAMPPELHLRIDVTLAPRQVLLVTYDSEERRLVAVQNVRRPAAP